jgi:hypothetical protein
LFSLKTYFFLLYLNFCDQLPALLCFVLVLLLETTTRRADDWPAFAGCSAGRRRLGCRVLATPG